MVAKHVPLRTCVQCRQVRPKRELIRIVRTPQGDIEIDDRGKAAGRGAYLCRDRACWIGAISQDRLDYALRMKLGPEHKKRLLEYGEQLPYADAKNAGSELQQGSKKGAGDSHHG